MGTDTGSGGVEERVLSPAMPLSGVPDCPQALWVGSFQLADLGSGDAGGTAAHYPDRHYPDRHYPDRHYPDRHCPDRHWRLIDGESFDAARLLVRDGLGVCGFVQVPVHGGRVAVAELRAATAALAAERETVVWIEPAAQGPEQSALVSVVLCTRDRPDRLRQALRSLMAMADAHFEVVVVDNASASEATADVVGELADPRIRLIREPVPGLSRARNRGAVESSGELLAFLDDDVMVDPHWLSAIRAAFARSPDIGCVTGPVPAGELRSASQLWFERRVSWGRLLRRREYRWGQRPAELPWFPFQVGAYGTGANMALRRTVFFSVAGLDERLGVGTVVKGGEDIDLFYRVLRSGQALSVEPLALMWHRHRAEADALRGQIVGYGRGLGAWGAKLLVSPRAVGLGLRTIVVVLRTRRRVTVNVDDGGLGAWLAPRGAQDRELFRRELAALAAGPLHYLRSMLRRAPAPLFGTTRRFPRARR